MHNCCFLFLIYFKFSSNPTNYKVFELVKFGGYIFRVGVSVTLKTVNTVLLRT